MTTDEKLDKLLQLFQEESERNGRRFQEIDGRFQEIDNRFYEINTRFDRLESELKGEINKVFMTLSQDIQVFAIDLEKVKRRVDRIEKRIA